MCRMSSLPRLSAIVLAVTAALSARAGEVYRCIDPSGRISFQDRPCAAGSAATRIELHDAAHGADPGADASMETAESEAPAPVADAPPPAPHVAPPLQYRCRRADGGEYWSDSGETRPYAVPLGMLGLPERSLAEAYDPRDGLGVSAPEAQKPRVAPPGTRNDLAAGYVWVQDRCARASPTEACGHLRRQLDDTRHRLRRAFKDERSDLEARERDLVTRMAGC